MDAVAAKPANFRAFPIACWLIAASVAPGLAQTPPTAAPRPAPAQAAPRAEPAAKSAAPATEAPKPAPAQASPQAEPAARPEPQHPQEPARTQTETPAVVIDGSAAETLLGKPVRSLKGEDMGRVVDVVVDRAGGLRAAVIDFGGFLGVGTRKIAVDWHVLHFPENGPMDRLVVDLQRDQLRNAPVVKDGEAMILVGAANPPEASPASSDPGPSSSPSLAPAPSAAPAEKTEKPAATSKPAPGKP